MASGESTKRTRSRRWRCSARPRSSRCWDPRQPWSAGQARRSSPLNGSPRFGPVEVGPSSSEIEAAHVGVVQEDLSWTVVLVPPRLEDIAAVRESQGFAGVLFDEHDGDAVIVDLADFVEDHGNEPRSKACGRLIDEHDPRVHHEGLREGNHLLLPAAEGVDVGADLRT